MEAVRRQQRDLEIEILLQEANVRYWTDLLTEARNLPPESPSSDEYGHDRRKALSISIAREPPVARAPHPPRDDVQPLQQPTQHSARGLGLPLQPGLQRDHRPPTS
eukprot:6489055-Pyramimonas_sp.AAC.1